MEVGVPCDIYIGKTVHGVLDGKHNLGKLRYRWKDNIKMDIHGFSKDVNRIF
jgi:hypothetical protein